MADPTEIPSPASRLVVAAAVLDSLASPTSMLCTARSYPAEHAGQFELPGGKTEPGETPLDALVRELHEEIDLPVRLGAEVLPSPALAVAAPDAGGAGAARAVSTASAVGAASAANAPRTARAGGAPQPDPAGEPQRASAADEPQGASADDAPAWPALHGYRMRVWLAEPADPQHGPTRGAAHELMRWVPLEELRELPWLPADRPILEAILERLAR